jgi:UDP-N-acetylmuramyl pentapeptide phosphotransferase/UDP-N-acetylglucosamine-1-phosphate transferase
MNQQLNTFDAFAAAMLGMIHPALGRRFEQGRDDAERGDISVAMVMWVSIAVLMAAGLGLLVWNKVKAKEATTGNYDTTGIGV